MSFFNNSSRGNRKGKGRRTNVSWSENKNKTILFSIHFDFDFDEFNQLSQRRTYPYSSHATSLISHTLALCIFLSHIHHHSTSLSGKMDGNQSLLGKPSKLPIGPPLLEIIFSHTLLSPKIPLTLSHTQVFSKQEPSISPTKKKREINL